MKATENRDEAAIVAAHKLARDEFEAFAAMGVGEVPEDETNALQVLLMRWQRDRFGVQTDTHDLRVGLGIIEECGETFEADNAADALDGLGDVIVYSGQLAIANRLALKPIVALAAKFAARGAIVGQVLMGRLAHVVLKGSQKIRGLDDVNAYRLALVEWIAEAIANAWETVSICHVEASVDACAVYKIVGLEVMARKRGDKMIPKAETANELDEAATGAIDRKAVAMDRLVAANEALGEAEKLERRGDFVVADEMRAQAARDVELAAVVGDAPGGLGFDTGGDA